MKRIIPLLLCLILIVGLIPFSTTAAQAASDPDAFLSEVIGNGLAKADAATAAQIRQRIKALLFDAQFRPDQNKIDNAENYFGVYGNGSSQKAVNANWPAKNGSPKTSVTDAVLGKITFGTSEGCCAYCFFATKYVYNSQGTARGGISANATDRANKIKTLICDYADPGEHISLLNITPVHHVTYLGQMSDGTGFYYVNYADNGGTSPTIFVDKALYSDFVSEGKYASATVSVYDTNGGSYYSPCSYYAANGKHNYQTAQDSSGVWCGKCSSCGHIYYHSEIVTNEAQATGVFKVLNQYIRVQPYQEAGLANYCAEEVNIVGYVKNAYGNKWYVISDGNYIHSSNVSYKGPIPTIPAPTGLSAVRSGTSDISLKWNAVSGAAKYEAEYTRTGLSEWKALAASPTTATSIVGKGFSWNYNYVDFRVRAVNAGGVASAWTQVRLNKDSGGSGTVTVTTGAAEKLSSANYKLKMTASTTSGTLSTVGMEIGTSPNNLSVLGSDGNLNKASVNGFYETSKYGYTLSAGTTYYYRGFALVGNSQKTVGQTKSFTTDFAISYNANGGSGAPAAQLKADGATLTLSAAIPTRAGYTFLGWAESSTATTAAYQPGGSFTKNANTTLYAVWETPHRYLDVNAWMDGTYYSAAEASSRFATFDVYVDGQLVLDDSSDCWLSLPVGARYEIKDIRAAAGYEYTGLQMGSFYPSGQTHVNTSLSGTIGEGSGYEEVILAFRNSFAPPTNVTARATAAGVALTWTGAKDADAYRIWRREGSGSWEKVTTTSNPTSFTDASVTAGKTYTYRVKSYKTATGTLSEAYSNTTAGVTAKAVMPAPKSLTAKSAGGKITLSWTAASGADKVRIWRKENVAGAAWVKVTTTGNPTTFTDSGVAVGKTYLYRVKSYNVADAVLSAGYSNTVTVKVLPALAAPGDLNAAPTVAGIQLTWDAVKGADGYRIWRREGSGSWEKVTTTGNVTSFTDASVTKGKTYTYRVKSYQSATGALSAEYSNTDSAKAIAVMLAPTNLKASATTSGVKLTWTGAALAAKYRIWRKADGGSWEKLTTTANPSSYTDAGAAAGVTYSYRIKSYHSNGTLSAGYSNIVKVTAK